MADLTPEVVGWSSEGIAYKAAELANGDLVVEGLAAVYGNRDQQNEVLMPGADDQAFLDRAVANACPVYWQHQSEYGPLGRLVAANARADGIFVRLLLPRPPERSPIRRFWEAVKSRAVSGLSFRAPIARLAREGGDALIKLRDALADVSIAPRAVNPDARIVSVASKAQREPVFEPIPTWSAAELAAAPAPIIEHLPL